MHSPKADADSRHDDKVALKGFATPTHTRQREKRGKKRGEKEKRKRKKGFHREERAPEDRFLHVGGNESTLFAKSR